MPSSIHSYGGRSTTSIATTRSRTMAGSRKVKLKWWERRPIIRNAIFTDLQKGSYLAAIYTLIESLFQISLAIFDTYCLAEAAPGTTHFRSFGISFLFVYSGNQHIRRTLMVIAVILFIGAVYLLVSSLILMTALRKEHEIKFVHWLRAMAVFTAWRTLTIIFQSLVNDLYFGYHQAMLIIWFLLIGVNVFVWMIVYANYQELSDITRLEDMAKLKMSTLSSLNASRSLSRHSLDSTGQYKIGAGGSVSSQPSPQIYPHHMHHHHQQQHHHQPGGHSGLGGGREPRSSTSSAASYSIQPSPRTSSGHNNTIPMACYNPNGQPSPAQRSHTTSRSTPSTAPV
ncbi:uncharacterized protein LOC128957004 [Oppia nitens]|uniref:uncharacterized protein LOC128957004 n=1 Tax=Oppia nitens TaxID=1686743 RepID=UPI0023D9C053|nr:uncharacterized protein LOC128957004 [Oppia nitens]